MFVRECEVTRVREDARGIFITWFRHPEAAGAARPGQIFHVRPASPRQTDPLLRRPFSVCDVVGDEVAILYSVVGRGTRMLSLLRPGDVVDVLGPVGRYFTPPEGADLHLIVAGGVGVAPFPFLARRLAKRARTLVLLGARSGDRVSCRGVFEELGCEVRVCTDDGSAGCKCLVSELFERELASCGASSPAAYACGPRGMMAATATVCRKAGVPLQVSLEERMGCGVGACLGCVTRLVAPGGGERYARVCMDGPVFDAAEVVW